ncbi:MAG: 16S rRNA (cytosine(1402)-N(4))-methyltransferase RsmH [Planctomycetes bacterium]|nr:16S rRNA (cytosine(1402)-N(4))-methyltransferase RsmH [Planctomycetota bacterium]
MSGTIKDIPLHKPVMVEEVLGFLKPQPNKIIVDCTIGTGGHASEILKRIEPGGLLIGIDKDEEMLRIAKERLAAIGNSFRLYHADYANLGLVLKEANIERIDGVLLDLGVSSPQLEMPERGFSFDKEGPLDMRMDRSGGITASNLLGKLSEREMEITFRRYGEERWSRRIARVILRERSKTRIETTTQLANIIERVVPPTYLKRTRIHPATRVFQALRIAVNKELESLESLLNNVHKFLTSGARIVVISFHSLEDRIVKNAFRKGVEDSNLKILTKKPLRPQDAEVIENIRSRSAKLRAAERV